MWLGTSPRMEGIFEVRHTAMAILAAAELGICKENHVPEYFHVPALFTTQKQRWTRRHSTCSSQLQHAWDGQNSRKIS